MGAPGELVMEGVRSVLVIESVRLLTFEGARLSGSKNCLPKGISFYFHTGCVLCSGSVWRFFEVWPGDE